jgi:hypothetical protein
MKTEGKKFESIPMRRLPRTVNSDHLFIASEMVSEKKYAVVATAGAKEPPYPDGTKFYFNSRRCVASHWRVLSLLACQVP